MAMTVAFSEGMNRFIQKSAFLRQIKHILGIDACFECHNDAFSKIQTDRQTDRQTF